MPSVRRSLVELELTLKLNLVARIQYVDAARPPRRTTISALPPATLVALVTFDAPLPSWVVTIRPPLWDVKLIFAPLKKLTADVHPRC